MTLEHAPVLAQEITELLISDQSGIYLDCTFGRGGHARKLLQALSENAWFLALDRDPEAIAATQNFKADKRFHIEQGSFADLETFAGKYSIVGKVSGILLDLGVSSPQLDDPKRGFSFLKEGPLDMRMDPTQELDAAVWINQAKEAEIARVLKEYGEERYAKRIAYAIVQARQEQKITSTTQLAAIIAAANPKWEMHKHPATRSFQAIRIFINKELEALRQALDAALKILRPGGRLAVISFHSLEDRMVKRFIRDEERGVNQLKGLPLKEKDVGKRLKKIGRAITPTEAEIKMNPRARSAILRIAEKLP